MDKSGRALDVDARPIDAGGRCQANRGAETRSFRDQLESATPTFNEPLTVVHSTFLVTTVISPHPRHFSPANLGGSSPEPQSSIDCLIDGASPLCLTFG